MIIILLRLMACKHLGKTQSIKMASPGDFINIKYFRWQKLVAVDIEVKAR